MPVLAVILATALTCAGALAIGQAACRVCGASGWTFLSAPVGLSLLMLLSIPAIHVPGHATTMAVVIGVLVVASVGLLIRAPAHRPPAGALLATAPVTFMVLLPFLASGRGGTLGVSFDNDMAVHLLWAEAIRSPSVAHITNLDAGYPIGPHALCAVLAQATGMRVDYAFAGEMAALPVLLAWTTLGSLRRVAWPGRAFVATTSALTFMVAGYYVEASFKEVAQALLVLGFALGLQQVATRKGAARLRYVPLAFIAAGSLSVYSVAALPWLVAILGLWVGFSAVRYVVSQTSIKAAYRHFSAAGPSTMFAAGALLLALIPQMPRILRYYQGTSAHGGTGIAVSELGNLVGPVSFWKAFGIWDVFDFRLPAAEPFHVGMLVAFGLLVTVGGVVWWLTRHDWAMPLALGISLAIWIYADDTQSPYVASKALVILSPLVMLMATRWLVELRSHESWFSSRGVLRSVVVIALGWAVLSTSVDVLRHAYVGPTAHADDLRQLESLLGDAPTLFLGWDNFIKWELSGTPVDEPYAESPVLPVNPEKAWTPGQALDFDDVSATTLNRYRYIIEPRDPAGSQPPPNMKLLRTTRYYDLWERQGPTPTQLTLAEGQEPGAMLNCRTAKGRALARSVGDAAVRRPNVVVPAPAMLPGQMTRLEMHLKPGHWWLSTPYTSPNSITVIASDLKTQLPANLDRPGNRWPIGQVAVPSSGSITLKLIVSKPLLAPQVPSVMNAVVATPQTPIKTVPLSDACGKYVDWYTSASAR